MSYLTLIKCPNPDSDLLYYGGIIRSDAEIAKWYGGRLENGYAQACRGSNPFLSANFVICYNDIDCCMVYITTK